MTLEDQAEAFATVSSGGITLERRRWFKTTVVHLNKEQVEYLQRAYKNNNASRDAEFGGIAWRKSPCCRAPLVKIYGKSQPRAKGFKPIVTEEYSCYCTACGQRKTGYAS